VAYFIESKPLRTVLRWQLYVTAASMSIAALLAGPHGAISAMLGGLVNFTAGAGYGWVASVSPRRTAGEVLRALLRAEASKLALIVVQLWLVLAYYKQVVLGAFFAVFVFTVIVFSMALLVRDRS
jgi:ATP synthase protein I